MAAKTLKKSYEPRLPEGRSEEAHAGDIGRLVDHILSVNDSAQLRRSLAAHFERLDSYFDAFLKQGAPVIRVAGTSDD